MPAGNSPEPKVRGRSNWFSSRILFAPFGRYQGDQPADLSADGLLIGREEQRAQLITALLDNTHRGAYLVTGLRGSGKTTLVKHCLKEYEEAAYERYLNRHVGRALLWDRLALFVFTGFVLFSLLVLHDLLEVLIGSALGFEPFLTIAILAILAVLLIPFMMAWSTLAFVAECFFSEAWRSVGKFALFFGSSVFAVTTLYLSAHALKALPALVILVAVAALPFAGIFSYQLVGEARSRIALALRRGLVPLLMVGAVALALTFNDTVVWYIFALQLFSTAMIGYHSQKGERVDKHQSQRLVFHLSTFLLFALLGFATLWLKDSSGISLWFYGNTSFLMVILALHVSKFRKETIAPIKQHKPLLLLFVKGQALLALGLHLVAPAWTFLAEGHRFSERLREFQYFWTPPVGSPVVSDWSWIVATTALLAALFFLEFEWIARARSDYRKDRPLVHDVAWSLGINRGGTASASKRESTDLTWREIRILEKRLFELTFFYSIFRHWNPLLVVPVNLGFDSLDHKRVIEAMLSCLRDEFEKSFINWRSPIEATKNVALFLLSLYLTFALSFHVFHINEYSHEGLKNGMYCRSLNAGRILDPALSIPSGMIVSCWLGGESLSRFLQAPLLYRSQPSKGKEANSDTASNPVMQAADRAKNSGGIAVSNESLIARSIQELGATSPDKSELLVLRMYHLIFLFLVLGTFQFLTRRYWPYYKTAVRLQVLLHSLTGKMREDSVDAQSIWSRLLNVFAGREKARVIEAEPGDPRAVEVATLAIMEKMQSLNLEVPYSARSTLNLPAPEIIFKLDELDKLGVGVIPEHDSSGPEVEPTQGLDLERRRSKALHNLFAEMKNILASGVARFIFIGGRNLHDEWMADLSSRRPLLANIFEVELHLPSLLTEAVEEKGTVRPNTNIQWFVEHLFEECKRNQERSNLQRMFYVHKGPQGEYPFLYSQTQRGDVISRFESSFAVALMDKEGPHPFQLRAVPSWQDLPARAATEEQARKSHAWQVFDDFIDFLSYRSRGNPRRLTALVESFLRDSISLRRDFAAIGHQDPPKIEGFHTLEEQDDHVLVFKDLDLYRVQLVAEIYRRFRDSLGMRFDFRDDKLIAGALHVSDFLLKFHRRAFGWGNLQRVDELVHIHRAPDLPQVFSQIIDSFAERYLHTIRNGMYDYRFSSDFSHELRYLSRHSEEELAAVNFTLDESQALKAIYRARFKQLQDNQAYEFISALGELHEFDEEYEIARFYYRKAISYLDERLKSEIQLFQQDSVLHLVLTQDNEGLEIAKRRVNWALARLRLNLQMAMSYERSEDFEQAQANYRNGRTFAAAVLRALLNSEQKFGELVVPQSPDRGKPDFMSTLKHFNLLFQPMLAEAWVCEKLRGGVDTSVRVIERSVWEVRWILPAVREEFDGENDALPAGGLFSFRHQHLNFYLTMAEQHNKAGDLMFFKGCPAISPAAGAAPPKRLGFFGGFLGRAHYHYAVSMHEIRGFVALRHERAARIQHPDTTRLDDTSTVPAQPWPDYLADCASDSLADLADTLVARISLRDVLAENTAPTAGFAAQKESLQQAWSLFRKWTETIPRGVPEEADAEVETGWRSMVGQLIGGSATCGLKAVLGHRQAAWLDGRTPRKAKAVDRKEALQLEKVFHRQGEDRIGRRHRALAQGDVQPLIALDLDLAGSTLLANYVAFLWIASRILEQGGHYEDAARKANRIVEIVVQYLLMARVVKWSREFRAEGGAVPSASDSWALHFGEATFDSTGLKDLVNIGVLAAEAAVDLYHRARFRFVDFEQVRTRDGIEGFAVGRAAPTALCAHICALGIHSLGLFPSHPSIDRLAGLCTKVSGGQTGSKKLHSLRIFKTVLHCSLERNAYPIFGRIHGLKILADDLMLKTPLRAARNERLMDRLVCYFGELEETADAFDAPLHFTAFHFGTTRALHALLYSRTQAPANLRQDRLLSARETLRGSIAMFSMQNTFYQTIDQLYYLYDDFNDRRVHSCHAQQMAGAELTHLLIEMIETRLLALTLPNAAEAGASGAGGPAPDPAVAAPPGAASSTV